MFQRNKDAEKQLYPLQNPIEDHVSEMIQALIVTVYEYEHIKDLLAERKWAVRTLKQVETKELEALKELRKLVKQMKLEAK